MIFGVFEENGRGKQECYSKVKRQKTKYRKTKKNLEWETIELIIN